MRSLLLSSITALLALSGYTQDIKYVRQTIETLCSPEYHGRGYVNGGDAIAAEFLVEELKKAGALAVGKSYLQPLELAVNTFPGAILATVNGQQLENGVDFIVGPNSKAAKGSFKTLALTPDMLIGKTEVKGLSAEEKKNTFVVLDDQYADHEAYGKLLKTAERDPLNCRGYVVLTEKKLTWGVGRHEGYCTVLTIDKSRVKAPIKTLELNIETKFIEAYTTQNVIAMVGGKHADSSIVFTAHYDHLGRMGANHYIPGASDNASGTAMLLDLVRSYQVIPPKFNTYFIFFAAEEAGLVGSQHFVEHPTFDLERIKFLINLDLTGDAKTGLTAVNGTIFTEEFELLKSLNTSMKLPMEVKPRKSSNNSDHYPFYEKGVPCFFIYTRGDYKYYHDVMDKAENLPLTNYEEFFRLIKAFAGEL